MPAFAACQWGTDTGHFPMICFSCHDSDRAWLMDECPLLEMSPQGCSGNMPVLCFLGGISCLKRRTMENKGLGVALVEHPGCQRSILSYPVGETVLQVGLSFLLLWTRPQLDEVMKAVCTWRPRFSCFCMCASSFVPPHFCFTSKGQWFWMFSSLDLQHSKRVNEMCSSGCRFWRAELLSRRRVLNDPGRGPGSAWSGLRI